MSKEEKLRRKQYLKTCKKYRKQLKQLIKDYGPWDYFVDIFLDIQINHWIEYYTLGYNVYAFERDDMPTRLEIATTLRKLYDNYKDSRYGIVVEEEKAKRELFEYLFKYLEYMWD